MFLLVIANLMAAAGRRRRGWVKGAVVMGTVISLALPVAACSSSSSSSSGGDAGGGAVDTICQILQTDTAAKAAEELLEKVSDGEWEGGLAADLVISAVQSDCTSLLSDAVSIVQRFFGVNPGQASVAGIGSFQDLSTEADDGIAAELSGDGFENVSGASIGVLVDNLCQDLHGSRESTPVADVAALLPGTDLRALPALNAVTAQVARNCDPLNQYQADALVSGIYAYLAGNEQLAQAPLAITSLTWSWAGESTIDVNWSASYANVQFDLWGAEDGQWKELDGGITDTSQPVGPFYMGHTYEFAVRAVAGDSTSPWSYLYPCLSCAS